MGWSDITNITENVSHGKCIALDEDILINNRLVNGKELIELAKTKGKLLNSNKNEWLYEIPNLHTFSIDSNLRIIKTKPQLFIQKYKGKMLSITTRSGRRIKVTPDHPFLINKMGKILWVSAKHLNPNTDQIAILYNFRSAKQRIKFENYFKTLSTNYRIITYRDFSRLKRKSSNFKNFSTFSVDDFNKLRIIACLNLSQLSRKIGCSSSYLSDVLERKERKLSFNLRKKLIKFFKKIKPSMDKNEVIFLDKKRKEIITKFKDPQKIDEDIVKWFSFLHAEGRSTETKVAISQKKHINLLNEFLKISKRKFGVTFKKFSEIDYQLNCKAFVQYLKAKYSFKPGNSRKSPICSWIMGLDKNLSRTFLHWFFSLECEAIKNGEIIITQANKRNINILFFLLSKLGIFPYLGIKRKYATNTKDKKRQTYYYLSISGRKNLSLFLKKIGLEDKNKVVLISNYILKGRIRKFDELDIHIHPKRIQNFWSLLGWDEKFLKRKSWYIDYKIRPNTYRISREKLKEMLNDAKKFIKTNNISNLNKIKELYLGFSLFCNKFIVFDRIVSIKELSYDGYVIDLHVPFYHNFIAGFGGIISHNTSIVKAITGRTTLMHSEELKRGITIRLGYADATFYKCKNNHYTTSEKCPICFSDCEILRTVSFVDCPGHETLMATVLTGAAIMDGALLVIAANEKCPQPQTQEHLAAIQAVGIKNVIIVQNKIDLVSEERAKESYQEIKNFVKGTFLENAPIIPVSAEQMININFLIEAIEKFIPTPKREEKEDLRMLVARSFDINKPGTKPEKLVGGVLGGSIITGKLKVGDEIEIRPGVRIKEKYQPLITKVVGLQKAGIDLEEAGPGGLVGVLTTLDPYLTKSDGLVGNVVGFPGKLPEAKDKLEIKVNLLERIVGLKEFGKVEPIKVGENLMVNVGTSRSLAKVNSIKGDIISVNLSIPVCTEKKQRLTISRQISGRWRLIGYGEII